jgi:hypothetical protein
MDASGSPGSVLGEINIHWSGLRAYIKLVIFNLSLNLSPSEKCFLDSLRDLKRLKIVNGFGN